MAEVTVPAESLPAELPSPPTHKELSGGAGCRAEQLGKGFA